MSNTLLLDRIFEPLGEALTPETARRIAAMQADSDLQRRVDDLADKSAAGTLNPEEVAEYDSYVRAMEFMSIMQSKARQILQRNGGE